MFVTTLHVFTRPECLPGDITLLSKSSTNSNTLPYWLPLSHVTPEGDVPEGEDLSQTSENE